MAKVNPSTISIELSLLELKYLKSLVGFVGNLARQPHGDFMIDLYNQIDDVLPFDPEGSAWTLGEFAVQPVKIDWEQEDA